jgi:catechol 2,3-dioxygenase-like lactoylglutathione lyase family enzyme
VVTGQTLGHISPFFIVDDLVRAVRFYEERLGFEIRFLTPTDSPFFAIVGRDGVQVYLKAVGGTVGALPNHKRHESALWDAFVFVDDPDSLCAEFSARGASLRKDLSDRDDGVRGFEIADCDGYVLFFGRPR